MATEQQVQQFIENVQQNAEQLTQEATASNVPQKDVLTKAIALMASADTTNCEIDIKALDETVQAILDRMATLHLVMDEERAKKERELLSNIMYSLVAYKEYYE